MGSSIKRSLGKWFRFAGRALISGWAVMWLLLVVVVHVGDPEPFRGEYAAAVALVVGVPVALAILSWARERFAAGFLILVGLVAPLAIPPARFGGYSWEIVAWAAAVITVPCWVAAGALIGALFIAPARGAGDG